MWTQWTGAHKAWESNSKQQAVPKALGKMDFYEGICRQQAEGNKRRDCWMGCLVDLSTILPGTCCRRPACPFFQSCGPQTCFLVCHKSSCILLFAILWTVAHQTPLTMGLSQQEYWSGLPFPPPGDLPDPGIELVSLMSTCTGLQRPWEALIKNWLKVNTTLSYCFQCSKGSEHLWDDLIVFGLPQFIILRSLWFWEAAFPHPETI